MPTADSWERAKALLNEALDRPPTGRTAWLAAACPDDALRAEVASLLEAHEQATAAGALSGAFADDDAGGPPRLEGARLGPYRLGPVLGEGGMGEVYVAERADGVYEQRVAVKLVRRGMGSPEALRRFRAERQILAGLRHPAIARLLDGGVADDGAPFLVMELVEGAPITDWAARHALPTEARLRLFLQACDAVAYAHRALVVHRDLKPGHILVTEDGGPDGGPGVKLLDFGIARLLLPDGAPDTPADLLTRPGALPMTPEYAAPELVRGEPVTTATDVYQLGLVLYELLTGRRPYRFRTRTLGEVERVVCTQEPAPPSTADRRLGADLDAVVLKALAKEPERRYAGAEALAADLRRHLDGLPVEARPATAAYRARRFVRRHRMAVVATAAVALALVAGLATALVQAHEARAARAQAEARFAETRALAGALLFEVHDAVADLPGSTPARALIVRRGVEYLDRLARAAGDDPALLTEIAHAYIRLGVIQGTPTGANQGDLRGARASLGRALAAARRALALAPADVAARRALALGHEKLGDVEAFAGDVPSGVAHARRALDGWAGLAAAHPDSARYRTATAISLLKLGDLLGHPDFPNLGDRAGALAQYRRALARLGPPAADPADPARDGRRLVALVFERIGTLERTGGRLDAAEAAFDSSFALRAALARAHPANAELQRDLGIAYEKRGLLALDRADAPAALPLLGAAVERYRALYAADSTSVYASITLAVGLRHLHEAHAAAGDRAAARADLGRAAALLRHVLATDATNAQARLDLARTLLHAVHLDARPAPARATLARARALLDEAPADEDLRLLRAAEAHVAALR